MHVSWQFSVIYNFIVRIDICIRPQPCLDEKGVIYALRLYRVITKGGKQGKRHGNMQCKPHSNKSLLNEETKPISNKGYNKKEQKKNNGVKGTTTINNWKQAHTFLNII